MSTTKSLHVLIDKGVHKRLKVAAASLDKAIVEIVSEALIFQLQRTIRYKNVTQWLKRSLC
ncbi:hypothetical protein UF16_18905 [Chromobacterium violaceum]|nr:hypothetical protein UF16_18905 [Chromobacterium violaceum]